MAVPSGVIIAWPSTAASIPANWTRVAGLDSRYVKGTAAGVNPNVTGGAATHAHTSASHLHTTPSHLHSVSTTGDVGVGGYLDVDTAWPGGGRGSKQHTHAAADVGAISGADTGGATGTWNSANSDPSYYTVIWIQSNGSPTGIPANALVLWATSSVPTGFTQHVGSKSQFLLGAAAGGNGGGTGGGAHSHTSPAHSHTISAHTHGAGTSAAAVDTGTKPDGGGGAGTTSTHTHPITTNATQSPTSSDASANSGSATYEPTYYTLVVIENTSGGVAYPNKIIALWLGTLASIPTDWVLCDGTNSTPDLRGKFTKAANLVGDVGTTGGADGHSHTAPATHSHSHTHTLGIGNATSLGITTNAGGAAAAAIQGHGPYHTQSQSSGASGSTAQGIDAVADSQPPFTTVAYIQLQAAIEKSASDTVAVSLAEVSERVRTLVPITGSDTVAVSLSEVAVQLLLGASLHYQLLGLQATRLFEYWLARPNIVFLAPLNERRGSTIEERTGADLEGTVAGSSSLAASLGSGFYGFNCAGAGYVSFGDVSALNFERTDTFSVFAVILPQVGAAGTIISKHTGSRGWEFGINAAGNLVLKLTNTATTNEIVVTSNSALTDNVLTMVGFTYSGSGAASGVIFYKDGATFADTDTTDNLNATIQTAGNAQFGARAGANIIDAVLGMTAVFNAILTAGDVRRAAWIAGVLA